MKAMAFKIKNYTTSVPVAQSISEIEQILVTFGATQIMKEYRGDGRVESLVFMFKGTGYKLPANVERVCAVVTKGKNIHSKATWEKQAERIAWRVIKDWIHSQLSIVEIDQAEWQQVLLPYAFNGEKTLYEVLQERKNGIAGLLGEPIKQNVKEGES